MFNALDRTGKGFLTAADMRPFAEQTGFTGTDREWQLEFEALCHESRSSQGLGLDAFAKLVNDDSEDGCYCTDSELQALLQGLHQGSVENNTSVPNSTPSRTIGQPLQATEARTTHHTIERTYTCGSLGREEGRDGGREGETERGREREGEAQAILAQAASAQDRAATTLPEGSLLFPLSFLASGGSRSQPGSCSVLLRSPAPSARTP